MGGDFEARLVPPPAGAIEGDRYLEVRLAPGDDGTYAWIDGVHHDFEGALRAFRYLAQKAEAQYDPTDARGRRVLDSIAKHIATLEQVKSRYLDAILKSDE